MFDNRAVALYHEMKWSPRSPNTTPCDFFFWGYLKSKVFVAPPCDMQDLRNRIQAEFENVRQNPVVIRSVVRSMEKRTRICTKNMAKMLNKNL